MYQANNIENEILEFWDKDKTFEKSVDSRPEDKPYHFYDGPPFATGLPHYGHIVASLIKDIVPRYWTMKGYRVERRWGWDCHGLPVENIIEGDLKLGSKKEIEEYGIDKFNEACRSTVLKYADEWKTTIRRMGRWVDMENDYKTMDLSFMESVWWVFRELWDKELIYKGYKSMHICPRCETPLSNFEVTQGYKDIKDLSVTAKFKLINVKEKLDIDGDVYVLAWTTTPWTLPGNVLLAVGENIEYVVVEVEDENYILAKERVEDVLKDKEYKIVKEVSGKDLFGLEYEPVFPYFKETENAFRIVSADFVTTEDGTGVVHIAPAFGEDDYEIGKRENTGWVQHVSMDGRFISEVTDFAGQEVKPRGDHTKTDIEIIKYLAHNGLLFSKEKYEHSYPHCWRCDTPLLNYATSSWFVSVTKLKEQLLKNNKQINWVPDHIKDGRFGLWLEGARDWAISRNRFWGAPLPVWESEDGDFICIGSKEELEKLSGEKVDDLHKHFVDKIEIVQNGKKYKRVKEVLDCWFESGSMPYGQMHYPFENKEKFEASFPAEFIAEGQDQTRGWFYTLHILATALTSGENPSIPTKTSVPAFKNVIVNGIVLAEDGKKMSKRLKNYPDPIGLIEKYGADAMRYYLSSSSVMEAQSLSFSESGVKEIFNKVLNTLWNVVVFYKMYTNKTEENDSKFESDNVLDKWIVSKLEILKKEVEENMDEYKLVNASRPIKDFIDELSTWYVRRSRDRFKSEGQDRDNAVETLGYVLVELSKIMAPFMPFVSEKIYKELGFENSVHLELWPELKKDLIDETVLENMKLVRKIVEMGLALRDEEKLKVRQPLQYILYQSNKLNSEYESIIANELNVKQVKYVEEIKLEEGNVIKEDSEIKVVLNIELTDELKKEGLVREIVRMINQKRKEKKMIVEKDVVVEYETTDDLIRQVFEEYNEDIKKMTNSVELKVSKDLDKIKINNIEVGLNLIN